MMTGRLTGWSSCCRQMFHVKSGCSARQKQVTQVKESDVCCSHSSVSVDTSFILSAALPWLGFLQQMPLPSLVPSSLLRSFCVFHTKFRCTHSLSLTKSSEFCRSILIQEEQEEEFFSSFPRSWCSMILTVHYSFLHLFALPMDSWCQWEEEVFPLIFSHVFAPDKTWSFLLCLLVADHGSFQRRKQVFSCCALISV